MEGFKDVIVSQPPAMYSKSAYAATISLENYKGILLCDRPTGLGGSVGAADGGDGGSAVNSKSFSPANPTGNPVGLGPSLESKNHRAQREAVRVGNLKKHRTQSHQVISRHRRWLHSFAQQMKQMQGAEREREVELARRAAKLREAEAQRRLEQQKEQELQRCADCGCVQESQPPPPPQQQQQQQQQQSRKKTAATSKKPKWAMTEDEALDDELGMNDDLLNFARNLDYEKFVSDYEVTEALTVMRDRVREIAQANNWSSEDILLAAKQDVDDDLASTIAPSEMDAAAPRGPQLSTTPAAEARAAAPGGAAQHDKEWDVSRGRVLKRAISRDALALAERLLAASPSMQKVHTKQSLARLLQRCALQGETDISEAALLAMANSLGRGQNGNSSGGKSSGEVLDAKGGADLAAATAIGPQITEPKVVKVHPEAAPAVDGASPYDQPRILREMQLSTERTQGLPYLYRCPAI